MELIILLVGLFLLATVFMPWVNHSRFRSVRDDIKRLQDEVRHLRSRLLDQEAEVSSPKVKQSVPVAQPVEEIKEETSSKPVTKAIETREPPKPRSSVPEAPKTDRARKAQDSFEQDIATKLPVWIGALSLICAAFFLVKYSIELGWMRPVVRVSLGGLFGAGLIAAGKWVIRRDYIANYERISQGLVGAGIVAMYASIYAALNLYDLLPPLIAFGGMIGVTALAVILSLRHGQPIAVFGLLGGLLTPALIGSNEPNAIAIFTYLFLLFSGMFMVLARKGWWVLAIIAIIGVFSWSAFWFLWVFVASDALVLVVFCMAVTAVVLAVTGRMIASDNVEKKHDLPIHGLNFMAIAGSALTIVWLSMEMTLTLFDWSMLGLLGMAVMALAYFKPGVYQRPLWIMLGASLVLYYFWTEQAPLNNAIAVIVGMSALYIGGAAFLMRQVSDPRFWAGVQSITGVSLYALSYFALDLPVSYKEPFGMFWGITSLILASLAIYQASDIREKYHVDTTIRAHLLAIYTLAAAAFIAMGLSIELPWEYVPLAIAGQIAVTAWIYQRTHIDFLKNIALILTLVFVGLHYEQIILFFHMATLSIGGNAPQLSQVTRYFVDAPLVKLGIPAMLMAMALWIFAQHGELDEKFFNIVFGAFIFLALAAAYYLFRYSVHGDYATALSTKAGFIERSVVTAMISLLGFGLLEAFKKWDIAYLRPWALGLLMIAGLRYIYFDCLIHNPCFSHDQFVGDMPLINGITLTYGLGALLWTWAVYHGELTSKKVIYKVFGFASLFAFATFSVRQYFHGGNLIPGSVAPAELYGYSVAWLLTGVGLLAVGIQRQNKTARMASLAFILLAILKVFLYDAAELEGLYRVFSFFGLGVSLIGLSFFYTRFMFSDKAIAGK